MKKFFHITLLVAGTALFAGLAVFLLHREYCPHSLRTNAVPEDPFSVTYQAGAYEETNAVLDNPYRGYYHLYGFTLSEEDPGDTAGRIKQYTASGRQMMLVQINLKNYADTDLSENALRQLDIILSEISLSGHQAVLRFLYDWDGKALETEPSSIDRILRHMDQLSETVNRYADSIFVLQSTFTGNCGEMTQTKFGSHEDNRLLMSHWAQVTAPSIYLAVRTPSHLRGVTQTRTPVSAETAYDGSLASRLGLFNDGMLGSVYDLGTYDDTPNADTAEPEDKGTREEELAFQNDICRFVPNGGEAVLDNPYNDLDRAIADLARMHVSYLNCDHDTAVMDKWKNTIYHGGGCFDGMNGFDYIDAHLGYRYLVSGSSLSCDSFQNAPATLTLTIQNTGFAPAYRQFDGTLCLTSRNTGVRHLIPIALDNRTIDGGSEVSFSLPLDIRSLSVGTYEVAFSLTDPCTKEPILFANRDTDESGNVSLGTLSIDPVSPEELLSFLLSR